MKAALLAILTAAALTPAQANDRPFLTLSSAAAEEDDERVWAIETLVTGSRGQLGQGLAAEYAFDPLRSVQFEFTRMRDRTQGTTALEAGVEFKWLFNRIERDGWGLGLSASLSAAREGQEGWRSGGGSLVLPLSIRLGQDVALLHFNAGVVREDGRNHRLIAAGIEGDLWRRVTGFVELAAEGEQRLTHGGVRWWLKRETVALDLSAFSRRADGSTARGWLIGLNWYDL